MIKLTKLLTDNRDDLKMYFNEKNQEKIPENVKNILVEKKQLEDEIKKLEVKKDNKEIMLTKNESIEDERKVKSIEYLKNNIKDREKLLSELRKKLTQLLVENNSDFKKYFKEQDQDLIPENVKKLLVKKQQFEQEIKKQEENNTMEMYILKMIK
jgi:hypothetical protein